MKKLLLTGVLILCVFSLSAQDFEWVKVIGGMERDRGSEITIDNWGNIYTIGAFKDTVDFDPGADTTYLISNGGFDIFLLKLDSGGNFIWARQIGNSSDDQGTIITSDNNGNVYFGANFNGTVDLNIDTGIVNFTSNGSYDFFIEKIDSAGNFIWVKRFGGVGADGIRAINLDNNGNIFTTGTFRQTVDFDPGAAVFNLTSFSSSEDVFVQKLDSLGNFVWAKKIGNSNDDAGNDIFSDNFQNVYITGNYEGTVDFNPGTGTTYLTTSGGMNAFILKLDSMGNFVWAKPIAGGGSDAGYSVVVDSPGNVYVTGFFAGVADFDPGPATYNLSSGVSTGMFMLRLNSGGNFNWAFHLGGPTGDHGRALLVDAFNNIYVTGSFQGNVDFNPGVGTNNLISGGSGSTPDIFVLKLDSAGNYIWATNFGGVNDESKTSITSDIYGNIYSTGYFYGTEDLDPSTGVLNYTSNGDDDILIHKLSQDLCSNIALIFDSVSNVSCTTLSGFASVHAINGTQPYSYTWNTVPVTNDSIVAFNNIGIYDVTVTDQIGCTRSSSILINGPAVTSGFDMDVNVVSTTFQPGYVSHIWADAFNSGCESRSGELHLTLDSLLSFNGSNPAPDSVNGNLLIWDLDSMNYDSSHFVVQLDVTTSLIAGIGDYMSIHAKVLPLTGDVDSLNNISTYHFPVINSYDPNDKKVFPEGECSAGYLLNNELITYTVRFQNTGNSNAINIYVLDTLNPNLDLNSVRIVGNSHAMFTEVLPGNVLKFRFDNIHLPDSNTNEPMSHGYVIFEVMPDSGVANNTHIQNTSHIFFDFNPPITTNSVNNVLVSAIPNSSGILSQSFCDSIVINGYSYNSPGVFTQYLDNYLGCDSVLTINLTLSTIDNSVSQTGFTLTANQPSATYQWIDCNNSNLPISGATNQSYTVIANGNYAVIVSANGCTDTSACQTIFGFGIEDQNFSSGLSASPNPTHNLINIQSTIELKNATIIVTDINGKILIQKNQLNGIHFQFDMSELNAGMYFFHIYSEGKEGVMKVVKN